MACVERKGVEARQEVASSGRPSSKAPPFLVYVLVSPEPNSGNPSKEGLISKVAAGP